MSPDTDSKMFIDICDTMTIIVYSFAHIVIYIYIYIIYILSLFVCIYIYRDIQPICVNTCVNRPVLYNIVFLRQKYKQCNNFPKLMIIFNIEIQFFLFYLIAA